MEIYYVNSKNEMVYLDRYPFKMLSNTSLFDYEWQYETKRNNRVKNIKKSTKTATLDIVVSGRTSEEYYQNIAQLYEILDYDCAMGSPGKLYCGRYYLQCYFYKGEKPKKYVKVKQTTVSFTIVTDLVNWVKEAAISYRDRQVIGMDIAGIDYPYDFRHDFMSAIPAINNTSFYPCDFVLSIYGPCAEPMITIGENVYMVHADLKQGDSLIIDSRNRKITRVLNDGTQINDFAKRNKDNYIFEKIMPGINPVSCEDNINFDILILDERGEPKWI